MNIGMVTHLFYPETIGDPFNCYTLSLKLVKRGHRVFVFTWSKQKRNVVESTENNRLIISRLNGLNFSLRNMIMEFPFLPALPKLIRMSNVDILHAHSHLFLTTAQAVKEAKRLSKPSLVTIHGLIARRDTIVNSLQYAYLYSLGSLIFKNATKILCLTKGDARDVIRYGCPYEKIRVIPNAVDNDLFKPAREEHDGQILWAGRFVPEKGLKYLVKAAKIVATLNNNAKFKLIGDGHIKPKIIKLVHKYGLKNRVVITGSISREELSKTLSKVSIFVLPSLKEGLPLVLLEAMACGKPVVGSDISGISDIVDDRQNGLLVPHRNPPAIADAILTLLNDKNLRQRLGQNARRLMLEKYSWDIISEKIEKIYYEVTQ